MHNRDILPFTLYTTISPTFVSSNQFLFHKKQQISSLEGWLHGPRKDGRRWVRRVSDYGQAFPHHEGGGENQAEVEDLGGCLPWFWRAESMLGVRGCGGGRLFESG